MKCPYVSETDSYSECDMKDNGGCGNCLTAMLARKEQEAPNLCDDQTLIKCLLDSADEAEADDPFLTNVLEFAADRIKTLSEKPMLDPLKAKYTLTLTAEEIVTFRENLSFVLHYCYIMQHSKASLMTLLVYLEELTSDRR